MAAIFELNPPAIRRPAPSRHDRHRRTPGSPAGSGPNTASGRQGSHTRVHTALLAAAFLVGAILVSRGVTSLSGITSDTPAVPSGELVVVGPGDTLWSIAEEHFPASQRVVATEGLTALNGRSAALRVGDVVALPDLG